MDWIGIILFLLGALLFMLCYWKDKILGACIGTFVSGFGCGWLLALVCAVFVIAGALSH